MCINLAQVALSLDWISVEPSGQGWYTLHTLPRQVDHRSRMIRIRSLVVSFGMCIRSLSVPDLAGM